MFVPVFDRGVFTPLACKYRSERIPAIGEKVAEGEFDIVLLQEIWTQADYKILCNKIQPMLPHTHYYNSGLFGSGLCVFSKFPIIETLEYRYSLNGYAHKVYHGDWFGGKSVGLCKVQMGDIIMNVYNTHLHAEYNEDSDEYLSHRIAQAFEMSQFVKNTSETCDVIIATGDFNLQPSSLGHKVIMSNGNFLDAWITQTGGCGRETDGTTCERPDNPFSSPSFVKTHPIGIRLDYILYRSNAGYDMVCDKCYVTLQRVPEHDYHYSDHDGVAAEFTIKRNITSMGQRRDTAEVTRHLGNILPILDKGERKIYFDQKVFFLCAFFCFVAVVMTGSMHSEWMIIDWLLIVQRSLFVLALGFFIWMGLIMINVEINSLTSTRKNVKTLLAAPVVK
ncbi:putative neutral sphingomyelinase [Lamellibrachia satsuma]|nr:putative neutral sphingomyelinase [Lamellibrachia satsuma]